jgi:hypothetical protein
MKALLSQTRTIFPSRRTGGPKGVETADAALGTGNTLEHPTSTQPARTPTTASAQTTEPTPAPINTRPTDTPQATNSVQRFAAGAAWERRHGVVVMPVAFEQAEKLRQDGWTLLPWRPLLGWDFAHSAEANRALKEDWKALWMGHVHGEDTAPDDPKAQACAEELGLRWDPTHSSRCALAFTEEGKAVGFAAFTENNRFWTPTLWHVADTTETPRVLLAASLRAARDARTTVLNPCADNALAISRGAEWFWEYWPVQNGGLRGAIAQRLLHLQRAMLDKRNTKLLDAHSG